MVTTMHLTEKGKRELEAAKVKGAGAAKKSQSSSSSSPVKTTAVSKTAAKPPCHEGNVLVFCDPEADVRFWGGGTSRGMKLQYEGVNINLTKFSKDADLEVSGLDMPLTKRWEAPMISLPITDGQAPWWPEQFWHDLIADLRRLAEGREKGLDVVVYCVGGHGRTGTVLAVLAGLMGVAKTDPVQFIRDEYCEKVVETVAQVEYIARITGIDVEAEARPFQTTTTYYPKGGYQQGKTATQAHLGQGVEDGAWFEEGRDGLEDMDIAMHTIEDDEVFLRGDGRIVTGAQVMDTNDPEELLGMLLYDKNGTEYQVTWTRLVCLGDLSNVEWAELLKKAQALGY